MVSASSGALMLRYLLLCACLAGCATPVSTGLSQEMPPALENTFTVDCDAPGADCDDSGADVLEWHPTSRTPSLAAQRDQQHQAEFDEANLLRAFPVLGLTLVGCLVIVYGLLCGQDWWQRRRHR